MSFIDTVTILHEVILALPRIPQRISVVGYFFPLIEALQPMPTEYWAEFKMKSPFFEHTVEKRTLFGGPEGDRTLEPHGCEPCALPAELQAHIQLIRKYPISALLSRRG